MLTITCHNGEKRIINEHPSFYKRDGLIKGVNMKATVPERCLTFAQDICGDISRILLVSNGVIQFERNYPKGGSNSTVQPYKENREEVKLLRKQFKNQKFTQKWNFTTGTFTDLLTGAQSLSTLQEAA
jgi:hypothetical protein